MSNTSDVTPYVSSTTEPVSTGPGMGETVLAAGAACALGAIAVAKWLAEETSEDVAARKVYHEGRRSERLATARKAKIARVELHARELESFVRSAERIGYRVENLRMPNEPLRDQPELLLRSAAGERIAIAHSPEGRVVLRTAGGTRRLQKLVRQHTADRVAAHFRERPVAVKATTLPNGEIQVVAREQGPGRGGAAEVTVQVRGDGSLRVDVDKVRGRRCEEIVTGIAEAVGGEVCGSSRKDSYFQLPGEPTKAKVKV